MLRELFTNHGQVTFIVILLWVVLMGVIFSRKKPRKERPDPPSLFGPIRGMYVCYQCDTIFNTPQCPVCEEVARIPLHHLTGSVIENERLATVIDRLQVSSTWELPAFQESGTDILMPEFRQRVVNGSAYETH